MRILLSAENVLEIAVQIEKKGAAYYRRAAQLIEDPSVKEMLEELAAMEDGHQDDFEYMRSDQEHLLRMIGEPDEEAAAYLQAFVSGKVFPENDDPVSELGGEITAEKILRKAINMELVSIAFYQGIKDVVAGMLDRKKVERIIGQERSHVAMLSAKLAAPGA